MPTNNPYAQLPIDPFAVAHKLQMPAAVFEAFKKTMCAGNRGHNDAHTDYNQAIISMIRFNNDLKDGLITHPTPDQDNASFINEVIVTYYDYCAQRINTAPHDVNASMLRAAHMAGIEILSLYSQDYAEKPVHHIIEDAINNLNAAIFYAARIQRTDIKRWTDKHMSEFFIKGVLSQKNAKLKIGMVDGALESYKAANHE